MKRSLSLTINLILLMIILILLGTGVALGSNPGSTADPIVTQSYVEDRLTALNNSINERLTTLENGGGGAQVAFSVFEVQAGQTVMLEENSLFILRSGEAKAKIDANAGGGLSDLTTGYDVKNDEALVLNHLLLTPRTDGRGVSFSTNGWVMISGGYTVE